MKPIVFYSDQHLPYVFPPSTENSTNDEESSFEFKEEDFVNKYHNPKIIQAPQICKEEDFLSKFQILTNFVQIPQISQIIKFSQNFQIPQNQQISIPQNKNSCQNPIILEEKIKSTTDFSKYKTEMCRTWQEKGVCSYGKKCMFAHGKEELMDKEFAGGYKSKICRSYHKKFFCPYGLRCMFIHGNRDLGQILAKNFYMRKMNSINFDVFRQKKQERLTFFKENMESEENSRWKMLQ